MAVVSSTRSVTDVEKAVLVDAKKTCFSSVYSPVLAIHALATICQVKVRSVFPEIRDIADLRPCFDTMVMPRTLSARRLSDRPECGICFVVSSSLATSTCGKQLVAKSFRASVAPHRTSAW